jgi:hypothetical protein
MDEMKARYAPDWVLIAEPQKDALDRLLGGKVVFRSPDQDECWYKARKVRLPRAAVRYMGECPEHMVLLPMVIDELDTNQGAKRTEKMNMRPL